MRNRATDAFVKGARRLLQQVIPAVQSHQSMDRHKLVEGTRLGLVKWLESSRTWSRDRLTRVIYGHTHEPDVWPIPDSRTTSYNLGSWIIEPTMDHGYLPAAGRLLFMDSQGAELRGFDVQPGAGPMALAAGAASPERDHAVAAI